MTVKGPGSEAARGQPKIQDQEMTEKDPDHLILDKLIRITREDLGNHLIEVNRTHHLSVQHGPQLHPTPLVNLIIRYSSNWFLDFFFFFNFNMLFICIFYVLYCRLRLQARLQGKLPAHKDRHRCVLKLLLMQLLSLVK